MILCELWQRLGEGREAKGIDNEEELGREKIVMPLRKKFASRITLHPNNRLIIKNVTEIVYRRWICVWQMPFAKSARRKQNGKFKNKTRK